MPSTLTIDVSAQIDKHQKRIKELLDGCSEIVAKVEHEDRTYTDDEKKTMEARQAEATSLRERVKRLKAEVDNNTDGGGVDPKTRGRDGSLPDREADDEEARDSERKKRERQYARAYGAWLRDGSGGLSDEQRKLLQTRYKELPEGDRLVRALSAVGGGAGGFTVPEGFISDVEVGMKDFSGVLKAGVSELATDQGNDIPWPTTNDTANEGEQIEENKAVTDSDPTFGQTTLKAFLFSSRLIRVPVTLMQDTAVNLEALLGRLIGERLGRITNRRWTTGNGANQPQGLATVAHTGKTAAANNAITYDELVDLTTSVDSAYWDGCKWMFNASTFGVLRKLKDGDGRPIWMPSMSSGMANGAPGTLMDKPYVINTHMDGVAAGKKSVLYGDFRKYIIRRVRGLVLVRLQERYAEQLQVGFFGFTRCDGRLLDPGTNPVKCLLHP